MIEFKIPKIKGTVAAVYKMKFDCGYFYIGGSKNIKQRMWSWKFRIENRHRKNLTILSILDKTKLIEFEILEVVNNSSMVKFREDVFIKQNWGNELLLNRSPNAFNNFGSKQSEGRKKYSGTMIKIAKVDGGENILEVYESIAECCRKNNIPSRGLTKTFKKYGLRVHGLVFRKIDKNGKIIIPPIIPNKPKRKGYKVSEKGRLSLKRAAEKRKQEGKYITPDWAKTINQIDKDGNIVATHRSINEASKAIGLTDRKRLSKLLNGRRGKTIYGFTFKYAQPH